jgi:hypothetical protein
MATALVVLIGGAIFGLAPAASAQTSYAPALCPPADTFQDVGTRSIGETFVVRLVTTCLWDPGSSVPVTVNGQSVGTKVVDAGGGVNVTITVVSATELRVDDPVTVRGGCGRNTVVGTGFSSAAQASETSTAVFTVACPAAAPRVARAQVAFTGANILRWGGTAVGLVAIGSLFVAFARRRRQAPGA